MDPPRLALADALLAARASFAAFLAGVQRCARVVVLCHNDADGLAAGALLGRVLPRVGFSDVVVTPSRRGESAFEPGVRERLRELGPAALVVADLGVDERGVLPGIPTLFLDHHRPSGRPPQGTVISGYAWDPIPATAWIAFELLRGLAEVEDLAWLAAVGTIGDLGERAPWPELAPLKKRYTASALREAAVLVNAARRACASDVETALRLLMVVDDPRAVSTDAAHGADRLHAYRREVQAELAIARRQPPRFSSSGPWALVRVDSCCQVHPLIAQQWRTRLPKYAVIAANTGYLPGVIAFSIRTARADLKLPALLQGLALGDFEGRFGRGHDQASGGHLPPDAFRRLLRLLEFPEGVW